MRERETSLFGVREREREISERERKKSLSSL